MFLKEKLDDQGENFQGGSSHIIFVSKNGKRFDITFLMTTLSKNVEATFSGHMYMLQNSFQLDTIILASKSCIKCCHISIPENI